MPDKWEYPWFAAWEPGLPTRSPWLTLDPAFAKYQLILICREVDFQHPQGRSLGV